MIMKKTTDPKETAKDKTMVDFAEKTLKNYEQIFKTGLKMQEEAGRCLATLLPQTPSAPEFQKTFSHFTGVASGVLPEAQKRIQEVLELVEKNSRTGVELMKKASDAARSPVIAQSKWMDLWTASLGTMRDNAEALAQINSHAIDSCIEFVQKSRVPAAA